LTDVKKSHRQAAAQDRDMAAYPSPIVFHARGLGKTYRAGDVAVVALRDVDLDIASDEFMVLLEPSGSGKSSAGLRWRVPAA
jgi:ABC-type lipoprotein export system ATPase subunit